MITILPKSSTPADGNARPARRCLVLAARELVQGARALLEPLLPGDPELFPLLHDIREHRAPEEDHVLPAWRVLDTDLEFLSRRAGQSSWSAARGERGDAR